jgi:outer membrane protein TolC
MTTVRTAGVGLALEWEVFDSGARRRRVELAESARRAASALESKQ